MDKILYRVPDLKYNYSMGQIQLRRKEKRVSIHNVGEEITPEACFF
jgi:hypothetical protein